MSDMPTQRVSGGGAFSVHRISAIWQDNHNQGQRSSAAQEMQPLYRAASRKALSGLALLRNDRGFKGGARKMIKGWAGKMGIIIIVSLVFTMGCSRIPPILKPHPKPWTKGEKAMAAFFILAHTADAYTTERHQDYPERFCEMNPLLGKHPRDGEIAAYFAITGLTALAIAHYYPELRYPLLGIYGGMGMALSRHNWRMIKDK
jgi:hypothetical protein